MELTNNSNEMAAVVETFVVEETAELIYDVEKLEKWNNLVGQLGLVGQAKVVKPEKSPVPFMPMNQSLQNVFEVLCSVKVDVENYETTPIPVEILDLIALSKREGYFKKIQIWYDDKQKDPVCVGMIGSYSGYWGDPQATGHFNSKEEFEAAGGKSGYWHWNAHYLLGRWADVKRSFAELRKMAMERFKGDEENSIKEDIKKLTRKLEDLDSDAYKKFN